MIAATISVDLVMQERLAAGNDDDRRAAFVDGLEAFLDAQPLVQDRVRIVDLAAPGAGEVAAEQRFQHQDERVALDTAQVATQNIGADADHLVQRDGHGESLSKAAINRGRGCRRAARACGSGHSR